VQLIKF